MSTKNGFRPESVSLNNYEKCFLFYLKSSFRPRVIQIFVFPTSPQFFLKINLKVYDVRTCLNKNLITHFNWYLKKEKRYDIETLSIDRILRKDFFSWKNHAEIIHQNPVQESFLTLVNNPKQPLHTRNCFKNKVFGKRIIKKPEKC